MLRNDHEEAFAKVRQELTLIETRAKKVSQHFQNLLKEAESLKVESLRKLLEEKIKSEARRRGAASVIKDKRRLQSSILVTAGSFILGGLLTQDEWGALNSGLAGLDGALQGFGRAKWVVLLGKRIVVAASENIPSQGNWLPWERTELALEELRKKAQSGKALGNIDDILYTLEHNQGKTFVLVKPATGQLRQKE